jgi:hypothetical protein
VPLEVVRNVLAAPNVPLPPLTRVTVAPVLSPTGELELEPGYHVAGRSYYAPLPGFQVPAIPLSPTQAEVERAKTLLLDELLGDFPFDGPAEKANALALALLPFGRAVIDGPTPIHFIEAPKPGTGKSKLAGIVTRLFCGPAGAPSVAETTDDEEWRKRITSMLATGSPFIFVDNVTALLDSSSLSTATTKTEWSDRRLGTNEQVTFDIAVVWIVTANNASVSADIARRSVRIRLNARVEDPFQRDPSQFRHPHLEAWVSEHWGELVWACLTLWRAWVAAGMPRGNAVLGSFENWAAIMSGVFDTIGVPGFLVNQGEFMSLAAHDGSRWQELVEVWWDRYGTDEVRPKQLYEEVAHRLDGFAYSDKRDNGRVTAFGMELTKQRDVIIGSRQITVRMANQKPLYRLVSLDGQQRTQDDWLNEPRPGVSPFSPRRPEQAGSFFSDLPKGGR